MKNLYSLILDSEIVDRLDGMAAEKQVSRSSLINGILAEYTSFQTKEEQMTSLFERTADLLADTEMDIVCDDKGLFCKSTLPCKYRPSLQYCLEPSKDRMRLKILFRSRSESLLNRANRFLEFWTSTEGTPVDCWQTENGKTVRFFPISAPVEGYAVALGKYIELFDGLFHTYLCHDTPSFFENASEKFGEYIKEYQQYIQGGFYE